MPANEVVEWIQHWRASLADFSGLSGRRHGL
jgi:hypothetical protein